MEKRKVTIAIDGRPYSFYSDDSYEYIAALEQRANAAVKKTAGNTVHTVIFLTDQLMRTEALSQTSPLQSITEQDQPRNPEQQRRKSAKPVEKDDGQLSVWELLDEIV